jgi:hypothetical protein
MCIVIGKYFKGIGWVGAKNRDRNYIPEISFRKKTKDGMEILYFWDDITQYCEGINSAGIAILSASLMVLDDEKEISNRAKTPSKDGKRIKAALTYPDIKAAAMSLIKSEMTGNTLVFNKDTMYLIEAAKDKNDGGKFKYKVQEIPHDQIVVRTNHGIWLPWAGYQRVEDNEAETLSRISSECRRLIAEEVAVEADYPEDILDNLTKDKTGDGQLNALRTTTDRKKMRTTSQILITPEEKTMYIRPVQSHMKFDFWKLNDPKQQTWVEILSNRVLYSKLKDNDPKNDPPFAHMNHEIG